MAALPAVLAPQAKSCKESGESMTQPRLSIKEKTIARASHLFKSSTIVTAEIIQPKTRLTFHRTE
jgi:hypothetical protein